MPGSEGATSPAEPADRNSRTRQTPLEEQWIADNRDKRHKARDGQGSIYARYSRDGKQVTSWRWQIWVEAPITGKPYLKRGSAKNEREARKAVTRVAALKDAHRLPAASASRSTVADLLSTYLAAKKLEASAKTYRKEEQFAALHIIPALGHIKQEKLTPAHVRTLTTTLAAEGLAPDTIKGVRGTLARALDQAVIDDILPAKRCAP